MPCIWHLHVHQWDGDEPVLSLDMPRHVEELPRYVEEPAQERDAFDELLLQPEPPPLRATTPMPHGAEGCANNAFGNSVQAFGPSGRPRTPEAKVVQRLRHSVLTDCLIFKYVDVHGPRWRALSRSLGGRAAGYSDDAVRNRYIRIMAANGTPYEPPSPRITPPRKPSAPAKIWTPSEDALIASQLALVGTQWDQVAQAFGGSRTTQAVRNRANRLGLMRLISAESPQSHPLPKSTRSLHGPEGPSDAARDCPASACHAP